MKIYDYFDDDQAVVLREILKEAHAKGDLPEYVVKSAATPSEAMREERSLFAWDEMKRFAIDTPADAWLSARYFKKQAAELPQLKRDAIWAEIKAGCEMHGVPFEEPVVKQAAVLPDDSAFLIVKEAADGEVLRLYPVATKQQIQDSVRWFPNNLVGDLAYERTKVAKALLAKAAEHHIGGTELLEEELEPTKRSHLLAHVQQRIDKMTWANEEHARWEPTRKAAALGGPPAPEMATYDPRLIGAYGELRKMAYADPLPANFWDIFEALDKKAGLWGDLGLTPPIALNREIEDDISTGLCKLADQFVDVYQLATKIAHDVWADVAPQALPVLGDMPALTGVVEGLDKRAQEILLVQLRGY